MTRIDMICTFPAGTDLEALGFAHTPPVVGDGKGMAYIRMTEKQADEWRVMPGVDVLVEEPFDGSGADTANRLYAALFADAGALEIYDGIYDRTPVTDEEGIENVPPERIGQVG